MNMINIDKSDVLHQIQERYDIGFIDAFINEGAKVYLFGGVPRDLVMGRKWKDADFCICISDKITERDNEAIRIFKLAGIVIQSVTPLGEDKTIFRFKDKKSGELIDVRVVSNVWAGGADFTINSLRFDIDTGELLDKFGGVADIHNKIIKLPDDPVEAQHQASFILFRAIKALCQFDTFTLDKNTRGWIERHTVKIEESIKFIVENDSDFVEWVQSQMFAGLKYNPVKYYVLMEEFGAMPVWVDVLARRLLVKPESAEILEVPLPKKMLNSFEESISNFLSLIARRIDSKNSNDVFEKIVDMLKIRDPKKGDDFILETSKILYIPD